MIRIAVIGAGYWGKNIVRTFHALDSAELVYVVDSNPDILKRYASLGGVSLQTDYRCVVDDDSIDAVAIATSAKTHYEIARDCLESGKHVFVEKPMTLEDAHSEALVRIADEHGLKLMVGHLLMYHPCITAMREYIDRGDIGTPLYLYSQRLNLGKVRKDENALMSFAPHDISIALYLMGSDPDTVSANGACYLQETIEDVVFLNLRFPGGQIGHIHVSWLDPHKVRRTTIVGSDRMIVFDDMEAREKIRIYDKGVDKKVDFGSYEEFLTIRDGDIHVPAIPMKEPLRLECQHFVDSIEKDLTPLSDGRNGLAVTRILTAGQKSLKNGNDPVVLV